MSDNKKIRVGLIGVGNWALRGHLPMLSLLPEFDVMGIYARRQEAATDAAKAYGIPQIFKNTESLANDPSIDLVCVLTTAPQHADGIRVAVAAGKHVYSEWPLTTSVENAVSLREAAAATGVKHFVGVQRRLAPIVKELRTLFDNNYIGGLRSVRLHVSVNYFQDVLPYALRWTAPPENFSSLLSIYAGHFLDFLFAAVGKPKDLSAVAVNNFPEVTIRETGEKIQTTNADELMIIGTLQNGAAFSFHLEGAKHNNSGVTLDITGYEGDVVVTNASAFGDAGEDYILHGARGDSIPLGALDVPHHNKILEGSDLPSSVVELGYMYAAIAQDIAMGSALAPTFDEAVYLHRLIDSIHLSAKEDRHLNVLFD